VTVDKVLPQIVDKSKCHELVQWLTKNLPEEEKDSFHFHLLIALDIYSAVNGHAEISREQLQKYCDKMKLEYKDRAPGTIEKDSSHINTNWLLPTCCRIGWRPPVSLSFLEKDQNSFSIKLIFTKYRRDIYNLAQEISCQNPQIKDDLWMNAVQTKIKSQKVSSHEHHKRISVLTEPNSVIKKSDTGYEKISRIPSKKILNETNSLPPLLKEELWELTRLECIFKLAQTPDDELSRRMLTPYKKAYQRAIKHNQGIIEPEHDDTLRAHFGYPHVIDSHARTAVKSALQILQSFERIRQHQQSNKQLPPEIYLIVHSFETVVQNFSIDQAKNNIHSTRALHTIEKLEALNCSYKVVISDHTYSIVRNFFDCREIDHLNSNSKITAYQVISDKHILTIFDHKYAEKFPLVGREKELKTIQKAWEKVQKGDPRLIRIQGMPGIGKSRLIVSVR